MTDNEARLTLTISPATFSEGGGANAATATITRNTPTDAALRIGLSSGASDEARVPVTVTIPLGQTSISFPITAVDDILIDGS